VWSASRSCRFIAGEKDQSVPSHKGLGEPQYRSGHSGEERHLLALTVIIIKEYHSYKHHTKLYTISFSQG
jgi:hypothetical protein